MIMTYQGVFERAEDGTIWGYVPELPGATGSGDTMEAAQQSLREAITIWIADAIADGDALPQPSTIALAPIIVDAA
jgi:predicted RNase H-like HicB family nuclease